MHDLYVDGSEGRFGMAVRKVGRDLDDAARLAHEAELLDRARHPGVVELLGYDPDELELTTGYVGPHSLETLPRMSTEQVARTVAAVADTVADLHGLGLVHGRVERSHVVIGERGRPVLCGFAGAAPIGAVPPLAPLTPSEVDDPALPEGGALATTVDIYGLGTMLRALLIDDPAEVEPIPEARFALHRLKLPWPGVARRALLTLADHATADEPSRRPSARSLAASIREAVPAAREPSREAVSARPAADGARRGRDRRLVARRTLTLLAVALGLALVVLGLGSLRGGHPSEAAGPEVDASPSVTGTSPPASCPPAPTAPAVDLDGDGCADATAIVAGTSVVAGDRRFDVGDAGDVLALGDWSCTGQVDVALLRPSTEEVFTFHGWATAQAAVTATRLGIAPGAVSIRPSTDSCPRVIGTRADGSAAEVQS